MKILFNSLRHLHVRFQSLVIPRKKGKNDDCTELKTSWRFVISMTKVSENRHTVTSCTDKKQWNGSHDYGYNLGNNCLPVTWTLPYLHTICRLIFQCYARTFLNASSPMFNNLSSKKNIWHGRGGVWFLKKYIIKYDFLRLKVFFSSYTHVNSWSCRLSVAKHCTFSYCRKHSLSKDFLKFKSYF